MSSERIIFKFKPSIDIENEYASSEQFISAYFEGIRMLLGENRLSFDVNNPEDALSVSYNGEYWQVTSLYSSGDAWGNTVELTINKMDEEQKLSVSTDMIGDEDVELGAELSPRKADGILSASGDRDTNMVWQVVKIYTMPDHQPGVKLMRIK